MERVCFLVLLFFLDKKFLHILKDSGNINIDLIKKAFLLLNTLETIIITFIKNKTLKFLFINFINKKIFYIFYWGDV